ncbi:YniB family protein [Kosakonia pseudosacchari]|uniref:YniB family protein n=1 Tax=Kosakonia pseudosacchari TaxID=1646340 RepID=UPI00187ED681|nr:YniB family protein [Kosakonia pseudosacchari]QOV65844.1 hypothetical protein IP581_09455 [Kosakonia pseudosacchari]
MNYKQAIKKIRSNRCVGVLLIFFGIAITIFSFLKYLYVKANNIAGDDLLGGLGNIIKNIILAIYNIPWIPKALWLRSPDIDPDNILSSGNILFLLFYVMIFVGVSFWSSASELSSRLEKIRIMIANEQLAASIRGEPRPDIDKVIGGVVVDKKGIYSKLHELYIAPLIVTVLGALLTYLFNLN